MFKTVRNGTYHVRHGIAPGTLRLGTVLGIKVVVENIGPDLCGYYDHTTQTVYISEALSPRERHCTLVHELIHAEQGHEPAGSLPEHLAREIMVEQETARRLISFPQLMWAVTYHGSGITTAEALGVPPEVYFSRILAMTRAEQIVFEVCGMQCIGVRTEQAMSAGDHPAILDHALDVDERVRNGKDSHGLAA